MGSRASKTSSSPIQSKRAYKPPEARDGLRILMDRLLARGIAKDDAPLDAWMRELGSSDELRAWFGRRPKRWDVFMDTFRRAGHATASGAARRAPGGCRRGRISRLSQARPIQVRILHESGN
ncbi:MAG: DUF488 domain-containing protein [Chloroflexota bacterium]|nr:MAG: hypothetical protein DLM70_15795 [Chloroflexota bacterium]